MDKGTALKVVGSTPTNQITSVWKTQQLQDDHSVEFHHSTLSQVKSSQVLKSTK